jgi:hypothetical protein
MSFIVYCFIFQHICITIKVTPWFYIDFTRSSTKSHYFVTWLCRTENPLDCVIWTFGSFPVLKQSKDFFLIILFWKNISSTSKEWTKKSTRHLVGPMAIPNLPTTPWVGLASMWHLLPRFQHLSVCLDLKPIIYMPLHDFYRRRPQIEKPWIRDRTTKDWRGNSVGVTLGCSSASIVIITISIFSMMKME